MKYVKAVLGASVISLALFGASAPANEPGKEAQKHRQEMQRERSKDGREVQHDLSKHRQETKREVSKHRREVKKERRQE